ncbi:MAG: helix-turn-helix transcriptional regulator [Clostridia bacterium]|nr:helix-turn-helix transcriptional regulator [Clostridia bacterium]
MKEKQDSGNALSKTVQAYIEAHCTEHFSLQEMAGALYMNGSYLLRTFRQQTGMTPLTYHHLMRCEKAKELLCDPRLSISQAGESAGFVSSSHFSHIFRKIVGCTPSEYRKQHMNDPERTDK